jgi:glycine betaine/proline transport system substrate-binding protein
MKNSIKVCGIALVIQLMIMSFCSTVGAQGTVAFADTGWESIRFHSYVAGIIIEKGYGYPIDLVPGSTFVIMLGNRMGDIDIQMEIWSSNIKKIQNAANTV